MKTKNLLIVMLGLATFSCQKVTKDPVETVNTANIKDKNEIVVPSNFEYKT